MLGLGCANIEHPPRGTFSPDQGAAFVVKPIVRAIALGSGSSGGTPAPLMMTARAPPIRGLDARRAAKNVNKASDRSAADPV